MPRGGLHRLRSETPDTPLPNGRNGQLGWGDQMRGSDGGSRGGWQNSRFSLV
jgi:hypothetical protein